MTESQLTNSDIAKLLPEDLHLTPRNGFDCNFPISDESSGEGGSLASSTFSSCVNINSDHTPRIRSNLSSSSSFSENVAPDDEPTQQLLQGKICEAQTHQLVHVPSNSDREFVSHGLINWPALNYEPVDPLETFLNLSKPAIDPERPPSGISSRSQSCDLSPSNSAGSCSGSWHTQSLEEISSTSKEAKFGSTEEITNNNSKSTVGLPAKLKKCGKGIMIDSGNSFEIKKSEHNSPLTKSVNGQYRNSNMLDCDQDFIRWESLAEMSLRIKKLESVHAKLENLDRRLTNVERGKGELSKNKGEKNEKAIRLLVANEKGEDYSKRAKCNNLIDAVENLLAVSGLSNVDQERIFSSCKIVVNHLKENGIYEKLFNWFYDQTNIRAQKNHNHSLIEILNLNPWLVEGELSRENVWKCIIYLDEDLKNSLKNLLKDPLWENHEYVSTSSGLGLTLLMFYSVYQVCPEMLPFPPPVEIEQDCRGKITIHSETVCIEIGEIKSSKKGVSGAEKQLARSLLLNKFLHEIIYAQQYKYKLKGDIFLWSEDRNKGPKLLILPPQTEQDKLIEYTKFIFRESKLGSATNMA